jgi:hypothetical protein
MSHALRIDARPPYTNSRVLRLVRTGPGRALESLSRLVDVFVEAQAMARAAHRERPFLED